MTIQDFIDVLRDNQYCIIYDGSLDIKKNSPLPQTMHKVYFDSVSSLVHEVGSDFSLAKVELAAINNRGITLQAQYNISEAIQLSINKRWKYSITYFPLVDNRAEITLTIWPSIGPIELTVIEYM